MIRKLLLVTTLTLFSILSFAQKTLYFDKDNKEVDSKEQSYYYRVLKDKNTAIEVKEYYTATKKLRRSYFYDNLTNKRKNGTYLFYFENGQMKEIGNYKNGSMVGLFKEYYKNGQQKSEREFTKDGIKYIQIWKEEGTSLLTDGNGTYSYYSESVKGNYHSIYKDHKNTSCYYVRDRDQKKIYEIADQTTEPEGGYPAFYKHVRKTMKYPKEAKRKGVEGKVYVDFIIDPQGNVSESKILRGIGSGCDEEILRVVNSFPKWKPGKVKGKPVNQRIVLPVNFKLG